MTSEHVLPAEFVCDHCGQEVVVQGPSAPYYTHLHGSIFCMTQTAEVSGNTCPPAQDDGSACATDAPAGPDG